MLERARWRSERTNKKLHANDWGKLEKMKEIIVLSELGNGMLKFVFKRMCIYVKENIYSKIRMLKA